VKTIEHRFDGSRESRGIPSSVRDPSKVVEIRVIAFNGFHDSRTFYEHDDGLLHGIAVTQEPPQQQENKDGRETPAAEFLRAIAGNQTSQKLAHFSGRMREGLCLNILRTSYQPAPLPFGRILAPYTGQDAGT
jgi:hypothetical protein